MVEVKTKYTLDIYKEYVWFSLFRGKYYRYGKATFPFLTALMCLYTIWAFVSGFDDVFISVIGLAGFVVCVLFYVYAFTMPKKYVNRSPSLFQTSMVLMFNDDSLTSEQIGDIASGTGVTKYEALQKVYETKTTFYLYLTPRQALLITKSDITKGTPEELRSLLRAKLPAKKYVLCK